MITAERIEESGITRLELARLLGIPYPTLTAKMLGYCAWVDGEEKQAEAILEKAKNGKTEKNRA